MLQAPDSRDNNSVIFYDSLVLLPVKSFASRVDFLITKTRKNEIPKQQCE